MDFESLAKVVNKVPLKWSIDDVARWLTFIGLDTLQNPFRQAGIDGSILQDLEPSDLEQQLNIKSNIIKKKIMNWVKSGLRDFTTYLTTTNKENLRGTQQQQMQIEPPLGQPSKPASTAPSPLLQTPIQKIRQLIIIPEQGTQSSMFCVSQEGGKIGRHSSNSILVIEESVSRYHAEITYDKKTEMFKIRDLKSSTGTYLKIDGKMAMRKGIVVELGSYQFLVEEIRNSGEENQICLTIIEGVAVSKEIKLTAKPSGSSSFKIGRKQTNQVFFQDTHLSSVHAVISFSNGKFSIEDMNSTNGTWLRLSQDPVPLSNYSVFKVGAVSIYKAQYSDLKKNVEQNRSDNCVVCYENERDALYLPCKHNLVCLRCSKMVRECPVCREKIVDTIKIYRF